MDPNNSQHPIHALLSQAPVDDEPLTDEEERALAEAWEDLREGRVHSEAQLAAELGVDLAEQAD